jgi:hypothetical protein
VKPNLIRYEAKSPPKPKGRPESISPTPPVPEETYFRGNQVVRVSPPSGKKKKQGTETMGETSAPSGLARQGNEPLGEGKPMTKAMRQRRKKTAIPTQKPVLPYNPVRNDPYFVK